VLLSELQPSISVAFHSDLAASKLWKVVADPLVQPQFSRELQAVRLIGDGPVQLGSRFEGDQRRGDREWTTISTVTTFEVDSAFAWTVPSQDDGVTPVSMWSIALMPVGEGTRIGQSVVLLGGPSPMTTRVTDHPETMFEVINERLLLLAGNMLQSLRGIEQLARSQQ
jgi:Polyketide cyclase / dehydrase and lipid transport